MIIAKKKKRESQIRRTYVSILDIATSQRGENDKLNIEAEAVISQQNLCCLLYHVTEVHKKVQRNAP